jgi:hypothetical protein
VITARLVGDDRVLAWLRRTPDAAASGIARTIAALSIDLQRRISLGWRDRIAATVSAGDAYAGARSDIRADLQRRTKAFGRVRSEKAFNMRSYRQRTGLPEASFMLSALEDMEPEIRVEVEAALRSALAR